MSNLFSSIPDIVQQTPRTVFAAASVRALRFANEEDYESWNDSRMRFSPWNWVLNVFRPADGSVIVIEVSQLDHFPFLDLAAVFNSLE